MKLKLALAALFCLNLNITASEKKFENVTAFKKYVVTEGLKTAINYSWIPTACKTIGQYKKLNIFSSHKPSLHSAKELVKIYGRYYSVYTAAFWIGGTLYHTVKN